MGFVDLTKAIAFPPPKHRKAIAIHHKQELLRNKVAPHMTRAFWGAGALNQAVGVSYSFTFGSVPVGIHVVATVPVLAIG
ncbi:MAG TPA: hypothetical protein V6D16_06665, partial [Candidatus Obscuribacterales bacterium]